MNAMGRPFKENACESTVKARIWRASRKAKADALGIAVKDLKREMSRANFWSDAHRKMLYHMAVVCCRIFREEGVVNNLNLDDLVNAAWLDCARRDKDVNGCGKYYLLAMMKHVRDRELSLNGRSHIVVRYLEEMEGFVLAQKSKINTTKEVDSADAVEYLLSLIPKESTRFMVRRLFVDGIHKAEIAREAGLTRCSAGSRIQRALVKIREDMLEKDIYVA